LTPQTSQKHDKNRKKTFPKNITKKLHPTCNQKGAKGDQKTTDKGGKGRDPGWNPPRKKKEYCKNQTYCGERVHAGRVKRRHFQGQHAPAVSRKRPGGESSEKVAKKAPKGEHPTPGSGSLLGAIFHQK